MRFLLPALLLLACAQLSVSHAYAYPIGLPPGNYIEGSYDFVYTEGSTGEVFTFTMGPSTDVFHADAGHGEVLARGVGVTAPPNGTPPGYSSPLPASLQVEAFDSLNVNYSQSYLFRNPYVFAGTFSAPLVSLAQDPQTFSNFIDFLPGTYFTVPSTFGSSDTLTISGESDATVPEPPSLLFLATGGAALLMLVCRRRRLA